jgi:hypothetical protein
LYLPAPSVGKMKRWWKPSVALADAVGGVAAAAGRDRVGVEQLAGRAFDADRHAAGAGDDFDRDVFAVVNGELGRGRRDVRGEAVHVVLDGAQRQRRGRPRRGRLRGRAERAEQRERAGEGERCE